MRSPDSKSASRLLAPLLLAIAAHASVEAAPGRYISVEQFLDGLFAQAPREAASLVVGAGLRHEAETLLGRSFPKLRVRYWRAASAEAPRTTAWVLDEIGKTEPITIGIGITAGRVATVRVLEFRESRGYEIRHEFFTRQFTDARLASDAELDRAIDSITGATMSVDAVQRAVRLALLLDRHAQQESEAFAQNAR